MKKNLLLILGLAVWVFILTTAVINKYDIHQQAMAAIMGDQTKLIDNREASLQSQITAAIQQTNVYKQQTTQLKSTESSLCSDIQTATNDLAKYHITPAISVPTICE